MNKEEMNRESLIIHIKGLQQTLTERNARIVALEAKIAELKDNPEAAFSKQRAYKEGWKACAGHLMETTRRAALELGEIRKDAFKLYLEGDKK